MLIINDKGMGVMALALMRLQMRMVTRQIRVVMFNRYLT